jgi:hypothetical protein
MKHRICVAWIFVSVTLGTIGVSQARDESAQADVVGNLAGYVPRLMQDFGWTRQQAVGAVANFAHESRGRGTQQIGMRRGGGFGWAQWTGPRRRAFMTYAGSHGLAPSSGAANYGFLVFELRTNFAHVAQRMRQARTAYEATAIFAAGYEGAFSPGAIPAMSSRYRWARVLAAL